MTLIEELEKHIRLWSELGYKMVSIGDVQDIINRHKGEG